MQPFAILAAIAGGPFLRTIKKNCLQISASVLIGTRLQSGWVTIPDLTGRPTASITSGVTRGEA